MGNFLRFVGGIAIAIAIHLISSPPASGTVAVSSRPALLTNLESSDVGERWIEPTNRSKPNQCWTIPSSKDSSSYEPPVEGGPQTSQGSGTR